MRVFVTPRYASPFCSSCVSFKQTSHNAQRPFVVLLTACNRLCLDDGNPSVVFAALNAIEAFLAPLARDHEQEEDMMQGLSWRDYQVRQYWSGMFRERGGELVYHGRVYAEDCVLSETSGWFEKWELWRSFFLLTRTYFSRYVSMPSMFALQP